MNALFSLIDQVLYIYTVLIFVWVILSWLMTFGVLPSHNPMVASVMDFLYRIMDPALKHIRRFLPSFGGIDLSPLVLMLLLFFLRTLLRRDIAPLFGINGF